MIPRPAADVGRVETQCRLHAQGFQHTARGPVAAPLSESNTQTGVVPTVQQIGVNVPGLTVGYRRICLIL
jgi:hypothetical protein